MLFDDLIKKGLTLFLLFIGGAALACHEVTIDETNAVDNGDGTYTYEFEACMGIEDTWGFALDIQGSGNLVNWTSSVTAASTGETINASVPPVSGYGDIEYGDWDNTSNPVFSGATSDCFTLSLTFDDTISSISLDCTQVDYINGPCSGTEPSTRTCFRSTDTYTVTIETYDCSGPDVSWDFDGTTIASTSQDGTSTTWYYCGSCASTFSIDAPAGSTGPKSDRCDGGVQSYEVLDASGNVTASGGGDNSTSYSSSVACTLPVELLSFEATCKGDKVELSWKTASEQNNAYFEVQRSKDGEEFRTIDKVEGAGTTPYGEDYKVQVNGHKGTTYYRLLQLDKNGKQATYGPIVADACRVDKALEISVNGNGSSSPTLLIRSSEEARSLRVRFYDAQGRLVQESSVGPEKRAERIALEEGLEAGVYYARLSSEAGVRTNKVVLGH